MFAKLFLSEASFCKANLYYAISEAIQEENSEPMQQAEHSQILLGGLLSVMGRKF